MILYRVERYWDPNEEYGEPWLYFPTKQEAMRGARLEAKIQPKGQTITVEKVTVIDPKGRLSICHFLNNVKFLKGSEVIATLPGRYKEKLDHDPSAFHYDDGGPA